MAGDNIFAPIAAAALTWRGYGEDEPTPCARHNSSDGIFLVRHTPAAYYLTEQARCRTAQVAAGTAPPWPPLKTPRLGCARTATAMSTGFGL